MKPALVLISTAERFEGSEFEALFIANGLAHKNYDIIVVCRKYGALKVGYCPAVKWFFYKQSVLWYCKVFWILLRTIREHSRYVLFCIDFRALFIGALFSRLTKTPLITVHHICNDSNTTILRKMVESSCTRMIAVSSTIARCCSETFPGVPVAVIPDTTQFKKSDVDAILLRSELGINSDDIIGISVADFSEYDTRFDILLATAELLHMRYPTFRLLIVGELPDGSSMVPSSCIAVGHYDFPYHFYSLADLFISTSMHEGSTVAVLDAVVRDVPVVTPMVESTKNLFNDDGWLVNEDDGESFFTRACEILSDLESAKNRAMVYGVWAREKFAPEKCIGAYEHLLDELSTP